MTRYHCTALTALALLICAGCATPQRRAEIPCGKWSGSGSFVAYGRSDKAAEGTPPDILDHGTYATHLTISQSAFEGQPTTRLEILSPHGEYEHMEGDRTHLVAHLWRDATLDDDTLALYRLIALGMSFDDKEPHLEKAEQNKRQYATCISIDGDLVLCVRYLEGFADTFRFHGDDVWKDGSYSPEPPEGLIQWSERLDRKR